MRSKAGANGRFTAGLAGAGLARLVPELGSPVLFTAHADWTDRFRAEPTTLGGVDNYGVEFRHPVRQGRARHPLSKERAVQLPLARRGHAMRYSQLVGPDRQLGLEYGQCP